MNLKLLLTSVATLTCTAVLGERPLPDNLVSNKETAIAVAEAILFPIYGKKNIESQRPYKVSLTEGEWYIFGSLPEEDPASGPVFGGVFRIVISQKDARVRSVGHDE